MPESFGPLAMLSCHLKLNVSVELIESSQNPGVASSWLLLSSLAVNGSVPSQCFVVFRSCLPSTGADRSRGHASNVTIAAEFRKRK
jgi:hypothetical protein